ncbi:hypothetical protein B0H17DRAFT_553250 [Mycena rosella]|uniref:Uncharacterized protein n=1 Tax=Mycena rosella TaxID=1033263 RepID=A0AAD7DJI9_MYCRO|nr:hypothetical protein B0H17DRAFT_553250 [Mycena rosella]
MSKDSGGLSSKSMSRMPSLLDIRGGVGHSTEPMIVPSMRIAEFCHKYKLSPRIQESLEEAGFETAAALIDTSASVLEDAGLKKGHIAELKRALADLTSTIRGGVAPIIVPIAEFCHKYKLSPRIQEPLEEAGFETAAALIETSASVLEDAGLKKGHIAELKRALADLTRTIRGDADDSAAPIIVPSMRIAEFCHKYKLSPRIQKSLEEAGFDTAAALIETSASVLEDAGLEKGH